MSYDIYIGNAEVEADEDGRVAATVDHVERDDAPVFRGDDMTGRGNSRHPSYSAWGTRMRAAGLHDLFFDGESGLMREHPGVFALTGEHLRRVEAALRDYKAANPDAKPGWCSCATCAPNGISCEDDGLPHEELDYKLATLVWLDYWVRWAVNNCEHPAILNH